jgi:glyoxylase-like metal-dependent hydrolase (beta-lactamase superfamily II)
MFDLNIKTFVVNQLQENCYVVSDATREAVIIDCGAYYDTERTAIVNYLRDNDLTPRHLLCTHGHFDHAFGIDTIFKEFGLHPEIHEADRHLVEDMDEQYRSMMGLPYHHDSVPVEHCLADGDIITFGTHRLRVIHVPGHSPGGLVFWCETEKTAFTGDTVFRMSVGRTDLPGGSWQQLMQSLRHLAALLPGDTRLYPGHGPITTMDDERSYNPYLSVGV